MSLLVVGHEPLGERMAGTSIRNWELARAVSSHLPVTIAAPGDPEVRSADFRVVGYEPGGLDEEVRKHDVVVVSGFLLEREPGLAKARHLVVDLYDPFPLENLHMHGEASLPDRMRIDAYDRSVLSRLIRSADMFMCASERQRDFWAGWLTSQGRVNPRVHDADPGLGGLLRVVPFGIPEHPPTPGIPRFRGVFPAIDDRSLLALWGGGTWNWFDPLTLIRAVAALESRLPQFRLVFPALQSPSPEVPRMPMAEQAQALARDLGVLGRGVIFGTDWVPYADRGQMLLEADLGVSLHRDDVETRYSFRTRVLDYLWAGLPVLTTAGDSMADLVMAHDLGEVVGYGDVNSVVRALLRLADPDRRASCSERVRALAPSFNWAEVVRPLVDYCLDPRPAPDRGVLVDALPIRRRSALRVLREDGLTTLARKAVRGVLKARR
ncbi:MAG: glycosyltransferase family 1 protein [Candidatus Dormibacteraceae bacterium]